MVSNSVKKNWYKKVSDLVSNKFGIEKGIGIGLKTFNFFKIHWIQYRKNIVLEKVKDSVSKHIGIKKGIRLGIKKNWNRKKLASSVDAIAISNL